MGTQELHLIPLKKKYWRTWYVERFLQPPQLLWVPKGSAPVFSWRHCFSPPLVILWLSQSLCSIFLNNLWVLWTGVIYVHIFLLLNPPHSLIFCPLTNCMFLINKFTAQRNVFNELWELHWLYIVTQTFLVSSSFRRISSTPWSMDSEYLASATMPHFRSLCFMWLGLFGHAIHMDICYNVFKISVNLKHFKFI